MNNKNDFDLDNNNIFSKDSDIEGFMEDKSIEEPKNNIRVIILTIIVIIILIVVAVSAYFKYIKIDTKTIYSRFFTEYSNDLNKYISSTNGDIYSSAGNLSVSSSLDDYKNLDNVGVAYQTGVNKKDKYIISKIDYKENNNSKVKLDLGIVNNELYLKSDKIYSKVLKFSEISKLVDFNELLLSNRDEDYKYLAKKMSSSLIKGLEKASYSNKRTQISVDDRNTSVKNNIMVVDSNNINDIKNIVISDLKKDKKTVQILAKLSGSSENEIISSFDEAISNKLEPSEFRPIKLELYTKGITNKFMGIKYTYDNNSAIDIIKKSDKEYKVTSNSNNDKTLNGTLIFNSKNDIQFEGSDSDYNYKIYLTYNETGNKKTTKFEFKFTNRENKGINVILDDTTTLNDKKDKMDISKSVDYDKLKEEEQKKVMNNFLMQLQSSKVLQNQTEDNTSTNTNTSTMLD